MLRRGRRALGHRGLNGMHRIERGDGPAVRFIGIDQCDQHIQPVAGVAAALGAPQGFNFAQGGFMIGIGSYRTDLHGRGRMLESEVAQHYKAPITPAKAEAYRACMGSGWANATTAGAMGPGVRRGDGGVAWWAPSHKKPGHTELVSASMELTPPNLFLAGDGTMDAETRSA